MQLVALLRLPLPVVHPARHTLQAAVDTVLNLPAVQPTQLDALDALRVSVAAPALHTAHDLRDIRRVLNFPGGQGWQCVAPLSTPSSSCAELFLLVKPPSVHTEHEVWFVYGLYVPGEHR